MWTPYFGQIELLVIIKWTAQSCKKHKLVRPRINSQAAVNFQVQMNWTCEKRKRIAQIYEQTYVHCYLCFIGQDQLIGLHFF
jgi:hypothetical protein